MGSDKPNNKENPPTSTFPPTERDEFALPVSHDRADDYSGISHGLSTDGADLLARPYVPLPVNPFLRKKSNAADLSCTRNIPDSSGFSMADLKKLNVLQDPQIDLNLQHFRSSTPRNLNDHFSNINRPQSSRHLLSSRGSRPMLYHTQNSAQNNREIKAENDVKVNADPFSQLKKEDGSFLSLGPLGGNTAARSKSYFSSQEIASKLEEADSPKLSTSRIRSSQNDAAGFSIPTHNAGSSVSVNDVGLGHGANTGLSSSSFHILRTPQFDMRDNMHKSSNRNSGSVGKMDARLPASPREFSSSPTASVSSRKDRLSGLSSGSDDPTWLTSGTASGQLQKVESAKNLLLESSWNSPFLGIRRSSSREGHSGPVVSGLEGRTDKATVSNQYLRRTTSQPAAGQHFSSHEVSVGLASGGNLFPKTIGVQTSTSNSSAPRVARGVFPKRLGVHVVQGAGADSAALFPKGMDPQAASNHWRPRRSGSVHHHRDLVIGPRTATGQPGDESMQFPANLLGPSTSTGQPPKSVPVQYWRPVSTNGRVIPVANVDELPQAGDVLGRPPLKRGAVQAPPFWIRRRKITTPRPPNDPYMSYQPQTGARPVHTTAHIKCAGFDGQLESTGDKCLLCNRDLISSLEGPVQQPPNPPAIAVLPCGHTFHDHCLMLITPEDQAKYPPCIPCAIGHN